jgi:hypothetical protein
MILQTRDPSMNRSLTMSMRATLLLFVGVLLTGCVSSTDSSTRARFQKPDAAFEAVVAALRTNDTAKAALMLGPESDDVLDSGDPVADRESHRAFVAMYDQAHNVQMTDVGAILSVGDEDWPLPIPVVQDERGWYFDTEEGLEEILDRRVGRNELATIQICLAYIDAQREYVSVDRDGDGLLEYAQKLRSSQGKKDGLYWPTPTSAGEPLSPFGNLAADASQEGYDLDRSSQDLRPYHGYYFRILKSQSRSAKGGDYDYLVGDSMIGGCALIAHPARYGISGVMTFIVNHDGVVYEKDLGKNTEERAAAIALFDPSGWKQSKQ